MQHFSANYYVHNDELYRKVLPSKNRYKIKNKQGKYKYLTITQIKQIIDTKTKK